MSVWCINLAPLKLAWGEAHEGWGDGGLEGAFARAGKFLRLAVPALPGNLTAPTKARHTAVHYKR